RVSVYRHSVRLGFGKRSVKLVIYGDRWEALNNHLPPSPIADDHAGNIPPVDRCVAKCMREAHLANTHNKHIQRGHWVYLAFSAEIPWILQSNAIYRISTP